MNTIMNGIFVSDGIQDYNVECLQIKNVQILIC